MAGFFRQTVQRTRATTSRLHSAAALPYAAMRESPGEDPAWANDAASISIPDATPRAVRIAADPMHAAPTEASWQPAVEAVLLRQPSEESPLAQRETDPAPQLRPRAARTTRSIVEHVLSLAPPSPSFPIDVPQATVAANVASPSMANAARAPMLRGSAAPKPQARNPHDPDAGRTRARARDAEPAAPEVHIHIGRVELTANTASSPQRSTPRERRPLSLDDYLQQQRTRRAGTP